MTMMMKRIIHKEIVLRPDDSRDYLNIEVSSSDESVIEQFIDDFKNTKFWNSLVVDTPFILLMKNYLNEPIDNWKQKYEQLSQLYEKHIKLLDRSEKENKRLKNALQMIANGMDINPSDPMREQVVGYFKGIAEATLKGG